MSGLLRGTLHLVYKDEHNNLENEFSLHPKVLGPRLPLTLTSTEHDCSSWVPSSLSHRRPQDVSCSSSPSDPGHTPCARAPWPPSLGSCPAVSPIPTEANGDGQDRRAQRHAPSTQLTHSTAQRPGPHPLEPLLASPAQALGLAGSHRASHRTALRGPTALALRTQALRVSVSPGLVSAQLSSGQVT